MTFFRQPYLEVWASFLSVETLTRLYRLFEYETRNDCT